MIFRSTLLFAAVLLTSCSSNKRDVVLAVDLNSVQRAEKESRGGKFAIATQGPASSAAAKKMFELGGNAIDAAAAASFAISVERQQSTGIGGGGFMLLHLAKENKTIAVDFRERAPLKAHRKMYQNKNGEVINDLSWEGGLSVGVPGTVAGILEIHERFGTLTREQVVAPAIEIAEKGFRVYPHLRESIEWRAKRLNKFPATKKIYMPNGKLPELGDLLVQKDLAKTLKEISKKGRDGFYKGWVARAIVSTVKKYGGVLSQKDLDQYQVTWRKPVEGQYKDLRIVSMPPPSSGGVHIIQMLNILASDPLYHMGAHSPKAVHITASAMQMAFADRAEFLGDADFVDVPWRGLASLKYARALRKKIFVHQKNPSTKIKHGDPKNYQLAYESDETTHFTIMDGEGNTVSSTQTVNLPLGSAVVAEGTGIVLNNEMDDFSRSQVVPIRTE